MINFNENLIMKFLFAFAFTFLSFISIAQVIITGKIVDIPQDVDLYVFYYNNPIENEEIESTRVRPDKGGNIKLEISCSNETPAYLQIGEQRINIYLLPKTDISFIADYNDLYKSIKFTGKNSADNNYLAAEFLEGFYDKSNVYSQFEDELEFKLLVDSLESVNKEFLQNYGIQKLSIGFKNYISNKIKYQYINTRWMDRVGYDPTTSQLDLNKPVSENFFNFLKSLDLNDETAYDNSSYIIALNRYLYELHDKKIEIPKEVSDSDRLRYKATVRFEKRKALFKNKVLDVQLTLLIRDYLEDMSKDRTLAGELLSNYRNSCSSPDYISLIDKLYKNSLKFSPGNLAPDFELQELNGNKVSLSSLKGKVVFMDFWATWCVPCLASMPNTLKLIDKFKDNEDVIFLFVNVSDNMESWEIYLQENNLPGINLYADKEQSKNIRDRYNISGIPRYILIDKDGKFIDAQAGNGVNAERKITDALNN